MDITGLEHIKEPFHWGIAMSLMGKGFRVTDPSTPIDDYIYWDFQDEKYYQVYKGNKIEKIFHPMERLRSDYKLYTEQ